MNTSRSIALMLVLSAATAVAQDPPIEEARHVLEAFLRINAANGLTSEEGRALLTGEAASRWEEPSVGSIPGSTDKIVRVDDSSAVARIPADREGRPDIYFYLRHDESGWRIEAMRYYSLTGILIPALQQLKERPPSPDKDAQIRNIELTLLSDAELRAWFAAHRSDVDRFAKGLAPADEQSLCKTLGLLAVERSDGRVKIVIGGILDNTVGFIYSPAESLPAISTDEFIWIEELAEGWFLYRTT